MTTSLLLGVDLSTQSCKMVVFDEEKKVFVGESKVVYDDDLPDYQTINGCMTDQSTGEVTSPTVMFVEALELCVDRLKESLLNSGYTMGQISSISGAAQQHGTVYFKKDFSIVGDDALKKQFLDHDFLLTSKSPIWMDTSTTESVKAMEQQFSWQKISMLTGSRAYERFSGHQIRKVLTENQENHCHQVQLLSNFGHSLFAGKLTPCEMSDAAGMNLLDIATKAWNEDFVSFCKTSSKMLGGPVSPYRIGSTCGRVKYSSTESELVIDPYWVKKHGFNPECNLVPWTGDNPSAVVGTGLMEDKTAVISLGTSDTMLLLLPTDFDRSAMVLPFGHIFPHPLLPNRFFLMLCYTNGDVLRKSVKDSGDNGSNCTWEQFDNLVKSTECKPHVGFFTAVPEICPPIKINADNNMSYGARYFSKEGSIDIAPSHAEACRLVLESRALTMAVHAQMVGVSVNELIVVGGGSGSSQCVQTLSDVFQAVAKVPSGAGDSVAIGGVVRASKNGTFDVPRSYNEPIVCNDLRKNLCSELIELYKEKMKEVEQTFGRGVY